MGQVTLYLDKQTEARMKAAAKAARISLSRWVSNLIREATANAWPPEIARLAGAWGNDFPTLEEVREGVPGDLPREPL